MKSSFWTSLGTSLGVTIVAYFVLYAIIGTQVSDLQSQVSGVLWEQSNAINKKLSSQLDAFQAAISHNIADTRSHVVRITGTKQIQIEFTNPLDPQKVDTQLGGGQWLLLGSDGYIITNKHVVPDIQGKYTVEFADATKTEVKSLRQDPFLDLAILKITIPENLSGIQNVAFVPRNTFALGQFLYRISYNNSDPLWFGIANLSTEFVRFGDKHFKPYIVFAQASKPGQSGSPVIGMNGNVLGLLTATDVTTQSYILPLDQDLINTSLSYIEKSLSLDRPKLGIQYTDVTNNTWYVTPSGGGIYVTDVYDDSLAKKAGIEAGDIIFSINDVMITPDITFLSQWLYVKPGDSLTFKVLRNGDYTSVTVVLPQKE